MKRERCCVCNKPFTEEDEGHIVRITCMPRDAYNRAHSVCADGLFGISPPVKVTEGKPKLAYTFRSTMESIAAVREYATTGPYKDSNNWKGVPDADWDQALLRHVMAYLEAKRGNGSIYDSLSHIHHLAHVLTTAGFLMENYTVRDGKGLKEDKK